MALREALRRAAFGLATVSGLGRRGFFIPYRYAAELPARPAHWPLAAVGELFDACRPGFAGVLSEVDRFAAELAAAGADGGSGVRWDQDWFPRLDAAVAYALVRARRPGRIVEVGSGHSTRFLARAVRDGGLGCRIVAIDPAPRARIQGLEDGAGAITVHRLPVHRAPPACFSELARGDVLFIDSSHILMPGSDVDLLLNAVLPSLPPGVLVHIHDVFLPDDYPPDWAWRGYNEQLALPALLLGGAWRPLFASHYAATRMAAAVAAGAAARFPLVPGARESSLWLERADPESHRQV